MSVVAKMLASITILSAALALFLPVLYDSTSISLKTVEQIAFGAIATFIGSLATIALLLVWTFLP